MASLLNAFLAGSQGGEQARDRADERERRISLASLMSQAYSQPEQARSLLPQIAAVDADAGMGAYKAFQQMDDDRRKQFGQYASVFAALPDAQKAAAYPQFAAQAKQVLGLPVPDQWDPEFAPRISQIAQALTDGAQGTPTGFRQFQMTADAAGLKPGTPEYQQAANIALGREGRASSAGFGFEVTEGADGRKRLQRRNPRTGAVEVYDESTGDFVAVGGGAQAQPSMPPPVNIPSGLVRTASGEIVRLDPNMSAADREAVIAGRINESGNFQGAPMIQQRAANPSLVVGRRPEDEAAAVETAKQGVQLGFMPAQEQIRTDAEIQRAAGTTAAKGIEEARLEAIQALPRVMQESTNTISLIDKALNHPGRTTSTGTSGRLDPRNYLPGTDATDFRVLLDQIKGGTFLQAFQSLKGGGAITQVEGTKAEQAIARLDTAQSDAEFKNALEDLREIAESALTRAQDRVSQYGGGGNRPAPNGDAPRGNSVLRYNPATGDFE